MRYALFLPACLLGELVAVLLAPVLPLFANSAGWLPHWLRWFQTPDNPLDGDFGHFVRWNHRSLYVRRVAWILRNRAYGFKHGPLGCEAVSYTTEGDSTIRNRGNARAGSFTMRSVTTGHWYKKTIKPIGFNYCIQLALGWQLDAPINGRCLFMFSPRITKFYKA